MSVKVRDYLLKVKKLYQEKSEEVEKKYSELKKLNAEYDRVRSSRDYTPEGRQSRLTAIDAKRNEMKRELAAMRIDVNEQAKKIRSDAEKTFYNYYNASPDDVDLKMTELIRSGVLTDAELIHYGERANQTMKRLIGKELSGRSSADSQRIGRIYMLASGSPHLQAIDSIMEIGDYAVGGARMGGLDTVPHMRERFDSLVDPVIAQTRDVSVSYKEDGSAVFTTEN